MNLRLTPCRTDRSPIVADRANASMARSLRSLSASSAAAPTHRSILYHRGKIQGAVIRPGAVNPAQRVTRLWTTPDAAPGEDPADRVWPPSGEPAREAGAGQAVNLQLPWLHLHLWQVTTGQIPAQAQVPARPVAGEAAGGERGIAAAEAPVDPSAGGVAGAGGPRLLRVSRGAD